jgi:hypothetical protein
MCGRIPLLYTSDYVDDSIPLLGDTGCCGLTRITEILRKGEEDFEKGKPRNGNINSGISTRKYPIHKN